MTWNETFQIIVGAIASVGGASVIILAISSYSGKIWAEKYLESIKKEYQKDIETYKSQLDTLKETSLRYSGQQFELYNKLWHSLYDLKLTADALWNEAIETNLKKFSKQLENTMDEVENSFLFIEDIHYQNLKGLLEQFSEYQIGKTKIIQLYKQKTGESIDINELHRWINQNGEKKQKYEQLINDIRMDLKRQIRGE